MSKEQTEAHRLADELDVLAEEIRLDRLPRWKSPDEAMSDAAAELRRLAAANVELKSNFEALQHALVGNTGKSAILEPERLRAANAELQTEVLEQARIIGMGAERELASMARIAELESANAELRERALRQIGNWSACPTSRRFVDAATMPKTKEQRHEQRTNCAN